MNGYDRAPFAPLRDTVYGIGFHWTTWTADRDGKVGPFAEAVENFDVDAFVDQARDAGAGHVLFTLTHADHHMPCPNAELDGILPGRTCRRDLVMELADGLDKHGIRLCLYYNHGIATRADGSLQDPEWQQAVGSRESDPSRYYDNFRRVVGCAGERYRDKVIAWWFDGGREIEALGRTPWDQLTAAAKAGHGDRLVCYNTGVNNFYKVTDHQDYWAGEINGLGFRVRGGPFCPNGLPWYSFCTFHGYDRFCQHAEWGLNAENYDRRWMDVEPHVAFNFARGFRRVGGVATFNLLCWRDGAALDADMDVMRHLRKHRDELEAV